MRFATQIILISLVGAMGTTASTSQEPTITGLVRVAGQDGPLQVVGLKQPERPSHYPLVHLHNGSSKHTKRIWIEALIGGRDGKVYRLNSNSPNELWPDERDISADGDKWAHEVVLEASRLVLAAKNLRSNCLNVAVLVMRVEFDDGSSWNRDQDQKGISWTYPSRPDAEDPCKSSIASESELEQLAGAGYRESSDADGPIDYSEVQSYSFSCSLVRKKEGVVAMCRP